MQGAWHSPVLRQSSTFYRIVELFYLISMEQHADVPFNNVVAQNGETKFISYSVFLVCLRIVISNVLSYHMHSGVQHILTI